MKMDKGIRSGVLVKFNGMLPQLVALGGKAFRREILDWTTEQYGCTVAAASTHYNHAKLEAAKVVPQLLVGLGRAADKNNGGRKKGSAARPAVTDLLGNMLRARPAVETPAVETPAAAVEEFVEAPVQTLYSVCKKSDGTVVASDLTLEVARGLVERAAAQKKAKLYFV
jgi:hypothetical protein